jgi:hypothetical protein
MSQPPTLTRVVSLPARIFAWARAAALFVAMIAVIAVGYRFLRVYYENGILSHRLADLQTQHRQLTDLYNQAIRRTAVTELQVADGHLSVVIRTADAREKTLDTPFDPAGEIYVDYVIRDGRLWIRRLFDARTPPLQGMLIDPQLGDVDWSDSAFTHGKAVYRSLAPGRWVVTVTGDGSLGLARREPGDQRPLTPAPPVRDYSEIEPQVRPDASRVTFGDFLRSLVGVY